MSESRLSHADLLELKRWNTPTIYNGWEQITKANPAADGINLEPTHDYMPQMGPMIGYAVTLVIQPSRPEHKQNLPQGVADYRRYVAETRGPKIVVVQDLDKPGIVGSFWGEVNANVHRSLGCVGAIVDGSIRDIDEMANAGFKALAARLSVGHAHAWPVKWNCPVQVFGQQIEPGQLIHADKHGFLAIPRADEAALPDAARFMDTNECRTVIPAARSSAGRTTEEHLAALVAAGKAFRTAAQEHFRSSGGEW